MDWKKILPAYWNADQSQKDFKKQRDKLNNQIKEGMESEELEEMSAGGYTATRNVQERTSMDSDTLLKILKDRKLTKAIKVVEMPDEQVVEDLMASGELTTEDISPAVRVKEVVVLKIKKDKPKKKTTKAKKGKEEKDGESEIF